MMNKLCEIVDAMMVVTVNAFARLLQHSLRNAAVRESMSNGGQIASVVCIPVSINSHWSCISLLTRSKEKNVVGIPKTLF